MYEHFACMYVCTPLVCLVPEETRGTHHYLRNEVMGGCEPPSEFWELNPDPKPWANSLNLDTPFPRILANESFILGVRRVVWECVGQLTTLGVIPQVSYTLACLWFPRIQLSQSAWHLKYHIWVLKILKWAISSAPFDWHVTVRDTVQWEMLAYHICKALGSIPSTWSRSTDTTFYNMILHV